MSADDGTTIDVVIVDDDPLVRSALTLMLGGQPDVRVVGEAGDGVAGIAMVRDLRPDVVLMDIRMPRLDGVAATRELHSDPTPPRVIVLTTFDADDHVVAALGAGAEGFLLKDTPPAEIVSALRAVASGDPMLSPSVTRTLIDRVRAGSVDDRASAALERLEGLTARERDVALCVGRGLSNAEIAAELYLSVPTVKAHVSRLFDKLAVTNRVQIAICVHDAGLA
ncbi:response regulator transcription factor [Nocardioides sp. HM23]|uniref:Response regulator transcription factor n=2 Tax=Nocardioides bizhenqiangii TaxID=3095076 RepID=A0ABZ0ZUY5_9ACTN|nr:MULTISPECIES: response regulator transcription factor [unclassified Nocardioides]MDZ5623400.1 response regulator transcription factor [Nocardioides sp. HM23]WQQ27724.1 response regulator transcription factor [Nocardioides sp. HM61]